jgi:lipoate-protein ligase B
MRKVFTSVTSDRGLMFKIYKGLKKLDINKQKSPNKNGVHICTDNSQKKNLKYLRKKKICSISFRMGERLCDGGTGRRGGH